MLTNNKACSETISRYICELVLGQALNVENFELFNQR